MAGLDEEATFFVPSDGVWLRGVDRPVVVDGRMFDATKPDEVVVGPSAVKDGLHVGSIIDYRPYGAAQDDTSNVAPNGPEVKLHVVGVVRQVDEYLFVPGMVMVSPAFLDGPGAGTLLVENAMVRLRNGAARYPATPARREQGRRARHARRQSARHPTARRHHPRCRANRAHAARPPRSRWRV